MLRPEWYQGDDHTNGFAACRTNTIHFINVHITTNEYLRIPCHTLFYTDSVWFKDSSRNILPTVLSRSWRSDCALSSSIFPFPNHTLHYLRGIFLSSQFSSLNVEYFKVIRYHLGSALCDYAIHSFLECLADWMTYWDGILDHCYELGSYYFNDLAFPSISSLVCLIESIK